MIAGKKRGKLYCFWKTYGIGTVLFMPFFILFATLTIVPVIMSIALSLTDYNMLTAPTFVGFNNYRLMFMEDAEFTIALKNTLVFAFTVGWVPIIGSFLMAWIINQLRFKKLFTMLFYIPSITGGGMAVIWNMMFSSDRYGYINSFLYNLGIIDTPIMFASDERFILPVIMIIYVWSSLGTGFLVYLAGLQNLSGELSEAGEIDGIRNRVQELWYIILPQMKPQLLFAAINAVTGAFGVFDVSTSFAGMPSVNYAGHTLVIHLYDHAFIRFEMGYASAAAVVLFCLSYFTGWIFRKALSSKD